MKITTSKLIIVLFILFLVFDGFFVVALNTEDIIKSIAFGVILILFGIVISTLIIEDSISKLRIKNEIK